MYKLHGSVGKGKLKIVYSKIKTRIFLIVCECTETRGNGRKNICFNERMFVVGQGEMEAKDCCK